MTNEKDWRARQKIIKEGNTLLEIDLWSMGQQKAISSITVWETKKGYEVTVKLTRVPKDQWKAEIKNGSEIPQMYMGIIKWAEGSEWFVTTRRNRKAPKLYKDLNRLNEHLKSSCPNMNYILIRECNTPGRTKKSAARKKVTRKRVKR